MLSYMISCQVGYTESDMEEGCDKVDVFEERKVDGCSDNAACGQVHGDLTS